MTVDNPDHPVLIDVDAASHPSPADAPTVAEVDAPPTGQAMQTMASFAARPSSFLGVWFWRLLVAVVVFFASVSAWNFVANLTAQSQILGWVASGLIGLFVLVCFAIVVKEFAALARLGKIEKLHNEAERVIAANDMDGARKLVDRLMDFYAGREDTRWGRERLKEAAAEVFDADTLLAQTEDTLLSPLDSLATREVEAAARQVATVTALVPLALADVLAALIANLRMIRRISEIYGGRSGSLGAWRLIRTVLAHLVATGAVAVGDDLIGSIGGGHLLGKLSRRFGEGMVNGALTARVGIAAMDVCRPLPFTVAKKPRVTSVIRRSLTGLFDRES